jgi:membrane protein
MHSRLTIIPALLSETFHEWLRNKPNIIGAALSFYIIFSLGPMLIVTVWLSSLIFGKNMAEFQIVSEISTIVGKKPAAVFDSFLTGAVSSPLGALSSFISIPLIFFSAAMIFFQLQDALHFIWEITPQKKNKFTHIIVDYFFSLTMILIVGLMLLILIAKSSVLVFAKIFIINYLPDYIFVIKIFDFFITYIVITFLFAMIYQILPRITLHVADIWIGAAVTTLMFTVGQYFIELYLTTTNIDSAYGAIGSFIVLFIWIFYSCQIFLLGAVFTKVYMRRFSKRSQIKIIS